jgi:D-glycero-alpha-D-manno-heptose-7-phosphate kinase
LAEEALKTLAKKEEMIIIGNLLNIGWRLKRNLAEGVSESWIDDIYQQSITAGAFGGKLMGAGGGGFFMFLVPPDRQQKFKEEMKSIKVWVPFKFDTEGTQLVLNT